MQVREHAQHPTMKTLSTLDVNEIFVSIQGEGTLIGSPTLFIRLDGCPLRCAWCDTPYALAGNRGTSMPVTELADAASKYTRVVITGGEPLAQDVEPLVRRLAGKHVTIETSGTIFVDLPGVALFSISPKVGTSGYRPKLPVLKRFCATAPGRMQLKFVIAGPGDLSQAKALVVQLGNDLPGQTPIVLQPESGAAGRGAAYAGFLRELTEWVIADEQWVQFDVRVLPQLHYLLWEGTPGR